MNIASILRHWFTLLATLITGWFVLPAEQQAELSEALGELVDPLVIVVTLVVTAVWRIALAWLGKILRAGSGEMERKGGPSGGMGLPLLIGTVAALGTALPSCSIGGVPVSASVLLPEGRLSYSAKGGLNMEYNPGYGGMPDAYREIERGTSK